ncbi:MAG: Stp1/IreP family PP2C-type Ser/Thr phosphatase [Clostridia bacterium]|nr:Stp1/IreP family PP2C-type Ser/Thr phosphatase [Clostridia bacterium]
MFKIVYSRTDVGIKRQNNEDYMLTYSLDESCSLYIVLDGIGGASGGEIASRTAAEKTLEYIKEHYQEQKIEDMLKLAVKYANKCVYEIAKSNKEYKNMGTTLTMLFVKDDVGYHISVGDSRIYELKENAITLLTEDDTYVNALLRDNIISREEAKVHPERHVLVRAIGIAKNVNFDVNKIENIKGRRFLLCTDGLTTTSTDQDILLKIADSNDEDICNILVDMANEKGGVDNITVMYVKA